MRIGVMLLLSLTTIEAGCKSTPSEVPGDPESGIAETLATYRAKAYRDVRYELSFTIPAKASDPIPAKATIRFIADDLSEPAVLDFEPGAQSITSVSAGGRKIVVKAVNGHIVVPREFLLRGENNIDVEFRAGDASLNRNPDFLYALFVPARSHLAIPCFDQPDMKARYALALDIPSAWVAVTNGAERSREPNGDRMHIKYAETKPIPTYLFTFAAGKFQIETGERTGRTFRMYHRETDAKKVERNRDAIFDLHAKALAWLENYTSIPYPFDKFDFVLIPSFQFGGMEHPGAIYYNASSMLLDESATENQTLGRASTISHETSHMWFGDLVTMRWFNDVWMKEVFANFMAAKIVNPSFPNVNHQLRFLLSNYPSAYGIDRTEGTHPIRQQLANLNEAGSLYGPIIYQKAPIVMRQLELILGPEELQLGLREYLKQFQFGNATWLDLVKVLDERTALDLVAWSRAWVEESGRPSIKTEVQGNKVAFVQSDPQQGRSLRWTEKMQVLVGSTASNQAISIELQGERTELVLDAAMKTRPAFVLPTGGGLGYGDFTLDDPTRDYLLKHEPEFKDPVTRGAILVTLWEELLSKRVKPMDYFELAMRALPIENTEQNIQVLLGRLSGIYWGYIPDEARKPLAPRLEQAFRAGIARSTTSSLKAGFFSAFRSIATTPDAVAFVERVWKRSEKIPGLTLAEPDEASMALELAIRAVPNTAAILEEQRGRFQNPDRKARFEFVTPVFSDNVALRDAWFESLKDVKNRRREPWVQEGLRFLNHPLRAAESEKYILPGLDLLQEIQGTGDIFFPTNWTNSLLNGHSSRASADTIRKFLADRPRYPIRLRRVVLQGADDVFRAADIISAK